MLVGACTPLKTGLAEALSPAICLSTRAGLALYCLAVQHSLQLCQLPYISANLCMSQQSSGHQRSMYQSQCTTASAACAATLDRRASTAGAQHGSRDEGRVLKACMHQLQAAKYEGMTSGCA